MRRTAALIGGIATTVAALGLLLSPVVPAAGAAIPKMMTITTITTRTSVRV